MLSALERRQANEDDVLWRQNASILRQLYQDEAKTLKEVKVIMENERGFPVTPLSTWEVKLRELGIQKKLKAKHWSLVYQHICARLQHEGKKELRKPTIVLINGTEKTWDKCWKEIRRNRALSQRPHQGPPPPLPRFITIRTPSPEAELLETVVHIQQPKSLQLLVQQLFQTTLVSLQPLLGLGPLSLDEQSYTSKCTTPDSVYKLCLQGIPFTMLLAKISGPLLSHAVVGPGKSQICDDRIIPPSGHSGNFAISSCTNPSKFKTPSIFARLLPESDSTSSAGQQLGLNFDSHHYLSMVIYLLSNNLLSRPSSPHEVTVSDILQITLEFVSRQLLLALFQSQLLSIRSGWESLLHIAQELKNKDAFEFLINIGIQNDWLEQHDKGHEYLFSAAQMNCPEILRALIARGCRIAAYPSCHIASCESVIVETINNGNLDCAKLLVQNCDVNHEFRYFFDAYKSTHFAMFIMAFDHTKPDHFDCLKFLLEQGADVDYEFQPGIHNIVKPIMPAQWRRGRNELEEKWPLSILDYVYYYHRAVFHEVKIYSKATLRFSRAMALWNLEQGVDALRKYLDLANPWGGAFNNSTNDANILKRKNTCFEILLTEQFFLGNIILSEKMAFWSRVAALLEINLTQLPKTKKPPIFMLSATIRLATSEQGLYEQKGLRIMQWLLEHGLQVNAEALLAAYTHGGVAGIRYLASFCNDIKVEGGNVLVQAVLENDFSSANLLLDIGVDPNSSKIARYVGEMNVLEAAACSSTLATMKHLVQRGVKPRIGISGYRPSIALVHMFLGGDPHELFNKVQYIVDEHMIYEPLWSSVPLLELCLFRTAADERDLRRKIFEFLLKKGAGLNVGSPIACWIAEGGGHQLVQEMLDAGADPNAHSFIKFDRDHEFDPDLELDPDHTFDHAPSRTPLQAAAGIGDYGLVCLLLEHGADLNAPALCKRWYAQTALQAICAWDPIQREGRLRKDKIVQLFLVKGANVNAVNSVGHTALMWVAEFGDISTAFTLLKHGAEPNAISAEPSFEAQLTALDIAAQFGRLDMVKFLLNANALSSTAWANGGDYEGAIGWARKGGYSVVSQLIHKHASERNRWNVPSGIPVATSLDLRYTHQSLSLQSKLDTVLRPQSRRQLTTTEDLPSTTGLDPTNDPSDTLDEGTFESSHTAATAAAKGISRAEVADGSETSVIEDIGDGLPIAEARGDEYRCEKNDEAAGQALHTGNATQGDVAWLYEPAGQSWVEDKQQSASVPLSSSLAEDVFMGFPGVPDL